MNITERLENIIFNKIGKTCLKLTLLFGSLGALLGGLVIGPLSYQPTAFEVEFSAEDMAQFKEQETENIERGLKYFGSEFNMWRGKQHFNEQIENGTCIPSYFHGATNLSKYNRFKKNEKGERKGKISSQYLDEPLDNAINRAIDKCSWSDFRGGYLMKNASLGQIGIDLSEKNPNGYCIVTAGWEKFHVCMNCGIVLGIIGFLLPIAVFVGTSILYVVICGPGVGMYRAVSRWMKWTFSEFFK